MGVLSVDEELLASQEFLCSIYLVIARSNKTSNALTNGT
jgi:hypothetical protein